MVSQEKDPKPDLVVLRCESCGDTFPSGEKTARCPSCNSEDVGEAHEPLL